MKNIRIFLCAGVLAGCLSFSSCAFLLVGAGVAGGMAISKDTAKLEIDRKFDRAWSAANNVITKMGVITLEDKKGGKFEANVRDAKVAVTIVQITPKSIRIEVKARKNLLPLIDLCNEIIVKILDQLK